MGLLNTEVYPADVHFFGGVHEDDAGEEVQAWVDAAPPPAVVPGRDALSLLLPLLGGNQLLISVRGEPAITEVYLDELNDAADQLLAGESEARRLTFARTFAGVPTPRLVEAPEGESDRVLRTALMQGRRKHGLWSRTRAPLHGGGYFAPVGHLMLIQHTARWAPYEETLVPAALGLRVAAALFRTASDHIEHPAGWTDQFNRAITSLVLSDDPLGEWKRRRAGVEQVYDE